MTTPLAPGLWSVLATPFRGPALDLDRASVRTLVDRQRHAGARGLVALGVFGESASLTPDERRAVVEAVSAAAGGLPLVIGLPELRVEEAVASANDLAAAATGLAAFMVQVSTPDPGELRNRLQRFHEGTGQLVVVQDYPVATGTSIATESLIAAIAPLDFVVAVKSEAPPTAPAIAALSAALGPIAIFGGLGGLNLLDELAAGASGAMTGFSQPEALVQTVTAWQAAGWSAARSAIEPWLPLIAFEAQPRVGLAIRKRSLQVGGAIAEAAVRPPAVPLSPVLDGMLSRHLGAVPV